MSNLSINESNDNSNVSILSNKSGAQSSTNSSPNLIVFKQPEDLSIQLQQQQQGTQEDTPEEEEEEEEEMEQITQLEVQQENQPDTLSSSPFISRPNSPLDDIIRPQGTSSPSLTIRDSYSSQVDINISNLHKSLNEMRLSTDPVDNNNNNNKVNKNNPTNSDISNDDIITIDNLTPSRIQPKNISPWRQFRPTLRGSPESTPRSLFQNKPNLKFNNGLSPTNGSRDMVTNNIATTTKSREEELNKRIVNYKIQLKLMKNFLQELIDRNNLDPHEFHTLLRRNNNNIMNNENNPLSTSLSQTSTLEIQHQNLQIELDEALELNKQLYNKIETANKEISDKDLQISNYESRINLINYSVDELIYILINEYDKNNYSHGGSNTTSPGKETLQQSISAQLEVKLNVLKLELMTRLDQSHQYNNKPHDLFTPPYTSSEYGVSTNNVANKNDLEGYIHIIEDLIKTVDELELTCENYKANKNELQNQLVEQINESIRIKNNFQIMSNKFNQLRQSLSEKENDKNLDEFSKNNHQQQQQQQIQQLEQKLIEYEKCITILQDELDQYKQPSDTTNTTNNNNNNNNNNNRSSYSSYNNHRNSSLNELNLVNDYLQLQTSYSRINDELNQVNNDYKLLNSSTSEKINNLTSKLQEKSIELRNQMGLNNKLQTELNLSLDKQRKYNTERIQMSYTVDSLRKDNEALQLKVNKLTDLMTIDRTRAESNSQSTATSTSTPTPQTAPTPAPSALATVARTASTTSSSTTTVNTNTKTTNENNNSSANIELGVKKISILEYQYKDLLLYDTNQFKRLIESYNKIADDKSLYDPKMKYEKLLNHITDINNSNGMGKNIDIIENITYIRDKHKSIFEYFIRATDILINDHIKLLLKENDDSIKVKYTKLNDKLNKLIKENESLKSELEFMNQQQQQQNQNQNTNVDGDDYGNTSTNNDPLSKLRMNDLRNKWKAERERRILEDQEAKKRFKELELEIQRLNEVIGNNNNNNNNNKGEQQSPLSGQDIAKNNQDHDNIQEILQSDSIFKTPEQVETHDILSTLTSNCYNEQGQELNLQGHQQINIHPDFYYNKHNESIFDDERIFPCLPTTNDNEDLVKYDEFNPELINHATIKALIIQMTSPEIIDYSLICDFFLTYRMFSNSNEIMNLLLTRLIWALQYLNSVSEDNIKIGKLVLVRTFVVLRHWIINYFVDDFNNNNELCDYFTNTINKITLESNLIPQQQEPTNKVDSNHSLFTRKILGDLKIHWLKIINEFWLLDLDIHSMLTNNSAYDYILPLTSTLNNIKKLSKSNTEASIRSNPSYRRSAMLSLYDQRIQHKMLIFDDTSSNNQQENPQFSINNLLLHHHSSRVSINNKIKTIQQQKKLLKSPTFSSSFNIPKSPLISNSNLANIPSPTPAPTHTLTTPTRLHSRSNNKRALMQSKRHNHMNIKDSSLDLKKTTTTISRNFDRTDIVEQEGDTDFDEEKENEETEEVDFDQVHDIDNDKSPESQFSESESKRYSQVGFSTNGNIKLPTSKVTVIVPPTPVKKMEKPPLIEDDIQPSSMTPPKLYHPQFQPPPSSSNSIRTENEDLNRRGSIRKLMDNWKKSLIVHKVSSSATDMPINRTMSTKPSTEDLDRLINNAMSVMNEKTVIGKRVDVLSARIIDELEYLIRYYISSESSSVIHEMNYHDDTGDDMEMEVINDNDNDLEEEEDDDRPHRRTRQDKGDVDLHPIEVSPTRADEIEMDINDLSDLNIVKIDNLINDTTADNSHSVKVPRNISTSYFLDEIDIGNDNNNDNDNENVKESSSTSFQSPISINWNDEDNINLDGSIEKTPLEEEFEGFEFSQEITTTTNNNNNSTSNDKKQTQPDYSEPNFSFQHSQSQSYSQFQSHSHSHSKSHETSSISTPSNITQYDAEIEELGIAMSPQSIKPKRISFCENTNINSAGFNKRLSVWSKNSITNSISNSNSNGSIAFKRDSMKSYVSYDSAFSVFNESNGNSNGNSFKIENTTTEYNGLKKKTAFNNLRSIVNNSGDGINLENAIRVVSSNQNHLSLSRHSSKGSGSGSRKSVRFSTLCALTELPFHEHIAIHNETIISTNANVATNNNNCNHSKSSSSGDAANSSIFSLAMKSRKSSIRTVNKESSTQSTAFTNSSNNSVAIPGISSYALKELAAIPDETMLSTEDPIQYALHKLEGKSSSKSTLKRKDDDDDDNDDDDDDEYLKQPHIDDDTQDILNEINNANTEDAIGLSNTSIEISQVDPPLTPIRMSCRNSNSDMTESDPITSTPRNSQYHENQQQQNHNHNGGDNNVIDTFDFQQPSKPNESTTPPSLEYQSPKIILDNYSPSSDLLSVSNVLFNDAHISFVLSYDSRSLADHFTMIEKDMLQEIDWKDLIELKWNKELTPVNSWLEIIVNDDYYIENKGVNLVIARFNLMVNWIISEILLTQSPNERIHLISRFIHIAQHCLELQNFATLMQIILALTSQRIQKLKQTWKDLIPGDILLLKNLEELASPLKNFLNIRLTINQIKPSKGCIPFVGLYLSDLTFNAERASIIKEHNHNLSGDGDGDGEGEGEGDTLINFAKFRTSVHIVKSLSQCIEWSSNYKFDIQPDLLSKCLYIKSLDEDEMKYCIQHNQK